jgi:hypothetical protein
MALMLWLSGYSGDDVRLISLMRAISATHVQCLQQVKLNHNPRVVCVRVPSCFMLCYVMLCYVTCFAHQGLGPH